MTPHRIIQTYQRFARRSPTVTWPKAPVKEEIRELTESEYAITTSEKTHYFFSRCGTERMYRKYTPIGYRVTRIVSVSPCKTLKSIRSFRFIPGEPKK